MNTKKSSLYSLLFTVFNDAIGWGIALTIFAPLIMGRSMIVDMSSDARNILLGFLIGSYAFTQFFSMPLIGALSDSFGRKKVLELTLIGAAFSFFLSGYAIHENNLVLLFISRLLAGLFSGNSATAQASIADLSTEKTKAKNLSLCGIVGSISWIIGPPLGGVFSTDKIVSWFDFSTPFWFLGIIFLINLIWLHLSYIDTYEKKGHHDWKQEIKDLKIISKIPKMKGWLLVSFLFYLGWFFFLPYIPTYFVVEFNFTQEGIGYLSGYMAIFFFITTLVMNRGLAEKISSETLTVQMLFLAGIMSLIVSFFPLYAWFIVLPFINFAIAVTWISTMAVTSNLAGTKNQGKVFGITQSLCSLGLFLGPLITGFVAAREVSLPILICSIILLFSGMISVRLKKA